MRIPFALLLSFASPVFALLLAPSASPAQATNFIANGGFEDGVYTATAANGSVYAGVPNGWTPNEAFIQFGAFESYNAVTGGGIHRSGYSDDIYYDPTPHSGAYELRFSDGDREALATLSQTFSDTSGASYSGSVWVYYGGYGQGDPGLAYLDVLIDGTPLVALNDSAPAAWTDYTFSFTGSGSDTLTLVGQTDPSEWYVDDVSVIAGGSGGGPTSLPEGGASGLYLVLAVAACCAPMLFRSRTIKEGVR